MVHKRKKEVKQVMKKGIHLFTPQRYKKYVTETGDTYHDESTEEGKKFMELWRDSDAEVAMFKGVAFFKNYIPLLRIHTEQDFFTEADPDAIYAYNTNDLDPEQYYKIVKEAKIKFNLKDVRTDPDSGGF